MIRIGVNTVYGMNDSTTFTEEDFKKALEFNESKNISAHGQKNKKLVNELKRLEAEEILAHSLNRHKSVPISEPKPPITPPNDLKKEPFYVEQRKNDQRIKELEKELEKEKSKNNVKTINNYFRSEKPPSVYKLSGDQTTFDEHDIEFNSLLPQRVLNDYFENQKKKYIDELTNKDLQKKPFIETKTDTKTEISLGVGQNVSAISQNVSAISQNVSAISQNVPKPPPKWRKFADNEGDVYYYNLASGITQWEKPTNFEE